MGYDAVMIGNLFPMSEELATTILTVRAEAL
jgi:hypothetical protein